MLRTARRVSFISRVGGKGYPFPKVVIPPYNNPNGIYLTKGCRYTSSKLSHPGSLVVDTSFSHQVTSIMDGPLTVTEYGQNALQKDAKKVDISIITIFIGRLSFHASFQRLAQVHRNHHFIIFPKESHPLSQRSAKDLCTMNKSLFRTPSPCFPTGTCPSITNLKSMHTFHNHMVSIQSKLRFQTSQSIVSLLIQVLEHCTIQSQANLFSVQFEFLLTERFHIAKPLWHTTVSKENKNIQKLFHQVHFSDGRWDCVMPRRSHLFSFLTFRINVKCSNPRFYGLRKITLTLSQHLCSTTCMNSFLRLMQTQFRNSEYIQVLLSQLIQHRWVLWTLDRECPKTPVSLTHLIPHHLSDISHLWIPREDTRIAHSMSPPDYIIGTERSVLARPDQLHELFHGTKMLIRRTRTNGKGSVTIPSSRKKNW